MTLRSGADDRGQTLVEFALIVPILVLLMMGILDLGRAVYAYHTLNNAAREGARQAIVDQYVPHIKDRATGHAVGLGVPAGDVSVDFRSPASPNTANSCAGLGSGGVVGCLAVVRVGYSFRAATPIVGNIVGVIPMAGESRFPVGHLCPDASCPYGE